MCAQLPVLGKPCQNLRVVLESPDMNKPKAFEALAELAVAIQLMSSTPRYRGLIRRHPKVSQDDSFEATAIFEIGAECTNISDLRRAVEYKHDTENERYANVLQILVIPLFEEFPIYDFFVFHRHRLLGRWQKCIIAAGYQCKMGSKYPDEEHKAVREVRKSVWIEGSGPLTRTGSGKAHGWALLSRKEHRQLLGESMYAALPLSAIEDKGCQYCTGISSISFTFADACCCETKG